MKSLVLLIFMLPFSVNCSQKKSRSTPKIDNGIYLTLQDKNSVPAVFFHSLCTGFAVSDNTMITAAHCWLQSPLCIKTGEFSGKCAISSRKATDQLSISNYSSVANPIKGQDLAVAVFPKGSFSKYFQIDPQQAQGGDRVLMVGYSDKNHSERNKGDKRWGSSRIREIGSETKFYYSERGDDVNAVGISPGDSGGPLIKASNCKIIGVASGHRVGSSMHTNLSANLEFLTRMRTELGAEFCGLPGADPARCPSAGAMGNTSNQQQQQNVSSEFPCSPGVGSQHDLQSGPSGSIGGERGRDPIEPQQSGQNPQPSVSDDSNEQSSPNIDSSSFSQRVEYLGRRGSNQAFVIKVSAANPEIAGRILKVQYNIHPSFGRYETSESTDAANSFSSITYLTYARRWRTRGAIVSVQTPSGIQTVQLPGVSIEW